MNGSSKGVIEAFADFLFMEHKLNGYEKNQTNYEQTRKIHNDKCFS